MSYLSTAQTKLNGAWQKPLPLSRNLPSTPRYGPLTLSSRSALTKHTGLPVLCPCLTLLLRAHPQRPRTPPPPSLRRPHDSTSPNSPLTAPTPISSPAYTAPTSHERSLLHGHVTRPLRSPLPNRHAPATARRSSPATPLHHPLRWATGRTPLPPTPPPPKQRRRPRRQRHHQVLVPGAVPLAVPVAVPLAVHMARAVPRAAQRAAPRAVSRAGDRAASTAL